MRLILLGPPGAGKGTQAVRLAAHLQVPHVSTGDLFRANIKEGTSLGVRAKEFIDAGQLVPDEVTLGMLFDRIGQPDCARGFILDGFPRTMAQAVALDEHVVADAVIDLTIDTGVLMERLCGRRVCAKCAQPYHVSMGLGDNCPACGGALIQRADDNEETVSSRLTAYHEQTFPLTAYYQGRGLLVKVDADAPIDEVTQAMFAAVDNLVAG